MKYILATIILTIYGQIVLKVRMSRLSLSGMDFLEKVIHVLSSLLDPWIISGFTAAFCASITWMIALSKIDLSSAYPMMSLSFVFVSLISFFFLGEEWTYIKVAGLALIVIGSAMASQ